MKGEIVDPRSRLRFLGKVSGGLDQGLANYGHRSDPVMLIQTAKAVKRSKGIAFSVNSDKWAKDPVWRKRTGDKYTPAVHLCVHVCMHVCVCMCVRTSLCMCAHVCMCVCICVYMQMPHMYPHTDAHTGKYACSRMYAHCCLPSITEEQCFQTSPCSSWRDY